ncbi:Thioredoxin F-type chloroplastic [Bienertia sinuspersici]
MALQLSLSPANPITSSDPTRCPIPGTGISRRVEFGGCFKKNGIVVKRKEIMRGQIRASLDTVNTQVEDIVGKVTQVNKDTFWPIVKAAGDKIVVLDMYTQWCGPCKAMAPKYEKLAEENLDKIFLKLDCNQENKILKDGKVVEEVTGAKYDALVAAIQAVQNS